MLSLGNNVLSLKAQRQLAKASASQSEAFTRLSSGMRINRASDDPAALAVSSKLSVDRVVYSQGVRNLNDGISILNVAQSALSQLTNVVGRLQELAEQAANGSYSSTQRVALDKEAQSLKDESLRIIQSTSFNGRTIFAADFGELRLQDGYHSEGSIGSTLGGIIGIGSFGTARQFVTGAGATEAQAGDLNADGIVDLVVANISNHNVSVLIGTGGGAFAAQTSYAMGVAPHSLLLGDFNGDGRTDLVTADVGSDSISVRLGIGDGTFGSAEAFDAGDDPASIASADFNGDGKSDLAVAERGGTVGILFGNGDGSFSAQITRAAGSVPDAIITADLNSDGRMDIIAADSSSNTLSVFLGTGAGTFSDRVALANGGGPSAVAAGDLNGDGVLDLVTNARWDDSVNIFIGRGDGTFADFASVAVGDSPTSVTLGDFNGDGLLDIASANTNDDSLSVLLNQGGGIFNTRTNYAAGDGPDSVLAADLNNDGVLELVTPNISGSAISVLIGDTGTGIQPILPFSLRTVLGAREALTLFGNKQASLINQTSGIGVFQSRINTAISRLTASAETLQGADARIRDTDTLEEVSKLARANMLKEAAAAVLAQANQAPSLALQLLSN